MAGNDEAATSGAGLIAEDLGEAHVAQGAGRLVDQSRCLSPPHREDVVHGMEDGVHHGNHVREVLFLIFGSRMISVLSSPCPRSSHTVHEEEQIRQR